MTRQSEPESYPETYYAGAYWGPRQESPEECARRMAAFLTLLAPCDPFLARWYKPAKSRKDLHKHPLTPPDLPTLTEVFQRGVNREDGGPPMEQLGYGFECFNGGASRDYTFLSIFCGAYSEAVANSCVLSPLKPASAADRVLTAPVLEKVMHGMVHAWEPDWAVATSWKHRDTVSEKGRAGTFVGWVTYLSRRRGVVPPLPAPVRIEKVEDKGTLVILTPERLTADTPEHLELGRRVGELLARAGLMQPILTP